MILAFKPQFVEPIIKGSKIHTIREDKTNRWTDGRLIQGATGVRTKKYNQFFEAVCMSTQKIEIIYTKDCKMVKIDGEFYSIIINDIKYFDTHPEIIRLNRLCVNDGFTDYREFFKWFNKPYIGKIINWTDHKYNNLLDSFF